MKFIELLELTRPTTKIHVFYLDNDGILMEKKDTAFIFKDLYIHIFGNKKVSYVHVSDSQDNETEHDILLVGLNNRKG